MGTKLKTVRSREEPPWKKKLGKARGKRQRPKDLTATKARAVKGGGTRTSDITITQTVNKSTPTL